MLIISAVFGSVNKCIEKLLSFYQFFKVKCNACSDLKAKMLAQRMTWLKLLSKSLLKIMFVFDRFILKQVNIC